MKLLDLDPQIMLNIEIDWVKFPDMIGSEIESLNFKQYKMSDCQKSQRVQ